MAKHRNDIERTHLGKFKIVTDPRDRRNPQSLRKTLYDITSKLYEENLPAFAEMLRRALRTRMGRSLKASFSAESIYSILSVDRTHLKYFHLESFARHLNIPASLILFYSRLRSNQQDKPAHLNRAMLKAFARIIADAQYKLESKPNDEALFLIEDFFRWVEICGEEDRSQEQEPELELIPPIAADDE
jgi:hypothetical protein